MQNLTTEHIFCPVCSTGRPKPNARTPWGKILSYSLFWTLISGGCAFLWVGISPAFWIAPTVGVLASLILEWVYAERFKKELVCPMCHFDPILYKKNPEEAKKRCLEGIKIKEEHFAAKWQEMKRAEGNSI